MNDHPAVLLRKWVSRQAGDASSWFDDQLALLETSKRERDLHIFLGFAPRKLGKADLELDDADLAAADNARSGWMPQGWSIDGAARVLGLLTFKPDRPFADMFKDLRRTSDLAELIAFYRGLPLYPAPDTLGFEVGEGLRSNLKPVFEAIAHNNPYPRDHFEEHRWNHMILKALFVETELKPVTGLVERSNPELARILLDYANERWAAGRPVADDLWTPVRPFANDPQVKPLVEKAIAAGNLQKEVFA